MVYGGEDKGWKYLIRVCWEMASGHCVVAYKYPRRGLEYANKIFAEQLHNMKCWWYGRVVVADSAADAEG